MSSILYLVLILVASVPANGASGSPEDAVRKAERRAAEIAEQQKKYLEKAKRGDFDPLEVSDRQRILDSIVIKVLEKNHLSGRAFDKEMARDVFKRYLDRLDPQRQYLLASDVEAFRNRHEVLLENTLVSIEGERIELAFDIFEKYRDSLLERIEFALQFIEEKPDLNSDSRMRADRSEANWAASSKELDRIWKKRVKNDAIRALLENPEWEQARKNLEERYNNLRRTLAQTRAEDVFENFLNAHARTLDPHSAYFSPQTGEEFDIRMSLSLEGIGAELRTDGRYVTINDIVPGGPADEDGTLRPGDRITGVAQGEDGRMWNVIGWRLEEVVQLIRGPKGTRVKLRYLPGEAAPGDPEQTVVLERSEVDLEERAASKDIRKVELGEKRVRVGVITVSSFYMDMEAYRRGREDYRSTTRDVRKLLLELKKENVDAVLIDLRDNGGGSLKEATELTGLFLNEGPVVQVLDAKGEHATSRVPQGDAVWEGPLGVMVNRFSASGSEIFASAIQDYGRGIVLGSRTYGKGTVQTVVDLNRFVPENIEKPGQLKFTVAQFYRVNGGSIQQKGVEPDVKLPSPFPPDEFGESTEPNALEWRRIEPVRYKGEPLPEDLIVRLREAYQDRAQQIPELVKFRENARQARELGNRDWVSLDLDERRKDYDEMQKRHLKQQNLRRRARGLEPLEEPLDGKEGREAERDILLTEGARIMADFVSALPDFSELELSNRGAWRVDRSATGG